ncbi:hypothetical protein BDV96DRAFT_596638 [Lophiotrema nucula]|uniref:BTB domain-containing protein n=1 Tax=Lophiotrema nucula TaxID=690887 RepID=A0A6A5ZKN4_9PLEO|nr:hypothetical protein BDV96DRAFT_596638 [Lophiotrema nucula]
MSERTQEKPLNELLSRSMVDIYVGAENTHWILHEKLLCYHSPFFRRIFYSKTNTSKSFGLPDEEDAPFKTFIGWLYSSSLPVPREEADLGLSFDLYLMAEKFQIPSLIQDVLQVVREWYKYSDSYPGLRRVQYIYANTEEGSPMRHMLVHAVARLMVLEKGIPKHWDKALRKNGQLAVDIIGAIQAWRLEEDLIPDARDDPAEAEDLMDEEVEREAREGAEEGETKEDGGEQQEQAQEGEGEGEGEQQVDDDEDATVVNSPGEVKQLEQKVQEGKKGGQSLVNGISKLGLKMVPNGLTNGDYAPVVESVQYAPATMKHARLKQAIHPTINRPPDTRQTTSPRASKSEQSSAQTGLNQTENSAAQHVDPERQWGMQ